MLNTGKTRSKIDPSRGRLQCEWSRPVRRPPFIPLFPAVDCLGSLSSGGQAQYSLVKENWGARTNPLVTPGETGEMKTVWLFFDAIFPITGASLPIVVSILLNSLVPTRRSCALLPWSLSNSTPRTCLHFNNTPGMQELRTSVVLLCLNAHERLPFRDVALLLCELRLLGEQLEVPIFGVFRELLVQPDDDLPE